MNEKHRKLLPTFAFVVTAALASSASAAEVDCTRPSGLEQVRACEAAKAGVDSLRQFIQRTRGIYILYIQEFGTAVPVRAAGADVVKVASADDAKVPGN